MGLHFVHKASESHEGGLPGFFLHLAPGGSFVGAGMWMPPTPDVTHIRQAILKNPAGWKKARAAGLSEDENALKRVPPGFDPDHPYAADLKRKGYVSSIEFTDADVTGTEFAHQFIAACKRLDPLNRFLAKAVGVDY